MSSGLRSFGIGPSSAPGGSTSENPHTKIKTPEEAFWKCHQVMKEHDEKVCRELKEEITFLMVVTGLFLAIVTPFTIESYKYLQEDKQDTMSQLLVEVVRLLNDTSVQGHAKFPERFTAEHRYVVVNQLWFLSTMLSLNAVLIGTFCLQWISAFQRGDDSGQILFSFIEALTSHHIRYAGFIAWGVNNAPEILLLIVQLSIALFTSGLIYFLWNIDHAAATPTLVVASTTGILLCLMNVIPGFQPLLGAIFPSSLIPQCPYKSPTSWFVRLVCDSLASIFRPLAKQLSEQHRRTPNNTVQRLGVWLGKCSVPWRDYRWRAYDQSYVEFQELFDFDAWLRCIGLGLHASLDSLVSERDVEDIINHSIQGTHQVHPDRDSILTMFGIPSKFLDSFLERGPTNPSGRIVKLNPRKEPDFETFLDNFVDFLVTGQLGYDSTRLNRILLLHRVTLYIELKESLISIFNGSSEPFSIFDRCYCNPLVFENDIETWDIGIQSKFLRFINRALDAQVEIFEDDFKTVKYIIRRQKTRSKARLGPSGRNANVKKGKGDISEVSFNKLCKLVKKKMANRRKPSNQDGRLHVEIPILHVHPQPVETLSIEPPSIEPSSIEPSSIESPRIEPPNIVPPSVEPPSVEPPSGITPGSHEFRFGEGSSGGVFRFSYRQPIPHNSDETDAYALEEISYPGRE